MGPALSRAGPIFSRTIRSGLILREANPDRSRTGQHPGYFYAGHRDDVLIDPYRLSTNL